MPDCSFPSPLQIIIHCYTKTLSYIINVTETVLLTQSTQQHLNRSVSNSRERILIVLLVAYVTFILLQMCQVFTE